MLSCGFAAPYDIRTDSAHIRRRARRHWEERFSLVAVTCEHRIFSYRAAVNTIGRMPIKVIWTPNTSERKLSTYYRTLIFHSTKRFCRAKICSECVTISSSWYSRAIRLALRSVFHRGFSLFWGMFIVCEMFSTSFAGARLVMCVC